MPAPNPHHTGKTTRTFAQPGGVFQNSELQRMYDHPFLTDPGYTTVIFSWWEGGLHFFQRPPRETEQIILLDTYYLSYIVSFICAYLLGRWFLKNGTFRGRPHQVYDILLVALVGVLLGAKLGYVLFYNLEYYLEHPLEIVTNWSGMASHGAIVGVVLAIWIYSRLIRLPLLHLADNAAVAACFGAIFIRFANFLNGELYGRSVSPDLPWAMRFPMRDKIGQNLYIDHADQVYAMITHENGERVAEPFLRIPTELPIHAHEPFEVVVSQFEKARGSAPLGDPTGAKIEVARMITDASHPSQLYQLLVSGLILFSIMLIVRSRARLMGTLTATFFIGYGISRFGVEFFRQPDPQRNFPLLGLTMGQLLSCVIIAVGVAVLLYSRKRGQLTSEIGRCSPENGAG